MNKRLVLLQLFLVSLTSLAFAQTEAELPTPLTLPQSQRPAWLREEGIVMGCSWEPLVFRLRHDDQTEPTAEQLRDYAREHSPETVKQLRELGVNFVLTHCYKGCGIAAERQGMEDAAKFAELCHQAGMHVGVYAFSGTLIPDIIRKERPDSAAWELLDSTGLPVVYGKRTWRHYVNRNNPDLQNYNHQVIDFAVNRIKADLLHFDNYGHGPAFDPCSVNLFREYLKKHGKPADFGLASFDDARPPKPSEKSAQKGVLPPTGVYLPAKEPLERAWVDFSCQALAQSYCELSSYARSLRPDILMDCNIRCAERINVPMDHGRMLRYGEAFWDEGVVPSFKNGKLQTRQIFYRSGQTMDNISFVYLRTPLDAAESLAYNTDCLGGVTWFENGKVGINPAIAPYVRFFHEQRPYYRGARRIADVAVLRGFASQCFAPDAAYKATSRVEQYCIAASVPWALIFDQQLADLKRYPALSLVGAEALSDEQVRLVRDYASAGGGLILTPETARYNEKMNRRTKSPLADLRGARIVRVAENANEKTILAAIEKAHGGARSLELEGAPGLQAEVTDQKGRRLVHLVNYNTAVPVGTAKVGVKLTGRARRISVLRPESPKPVPLEFTQENGRAVFSVSAIKCYALACIEM